MFRNWHLWALTSLVTLSPIPAAAEPTDSERISAAVVEMAPLDGATLIVDGRAYGGTLAVSSSSTGVVVVEETTVDAYLLGIAEVPFSWHEEALRAQATAARTYLAWTLDRGRSTNGRRFGYDICATDQCQVYRGLDGVEGVDGDRWRDAVEATAGEILTVDGAPLQALYSSTSGGRTRSVEDVFGGPSNPHLVGVASPNERSPFASWRFVMSAAEMEALATEAGHVAGSLLTVRTRLTEDGGGPWMVDFVGTEGTVSVPTWELRTDLNRAARAVLADRLPVMRPDRPGVRYPQTILSPSFTITRQTRFVAEPGSAPTFEPEYAVSGNGWGHNVGMSQYGAQAMAERGAADDEILAHYYGGSRPIPAGDLLPTSVRVALSTGAERVVVETDGAVAVTIDGVQVDPGVVGRWEFTIDGSALLADPPAGLGLPPKIADLAISPDGAVLVGRLVSGAEVRFTVSDGGRPVAVTDWSVLGPGAFVRALPPGLDGPVRVTVESSSPKGGDEAIAVAVLGAR